MIDSPRLVQRYLDLVRSTRPACLWPLDGISGGTVIDPIGGGAGAVFPGVGVGAGLPGMGRAAATFDGSANAYVNLGQPASMAPLVLDYSAAGWFRLDAAKGAHTLFGQYSDALSGNMPKVLRVDGGAFVYYTSKSAAPLYQEAWNLAPVSVGPWHHWAVIVTGTLAAARAAVWLDGVVQSTALAAMAAPTNTNIDTYLGWYAKKDPNFALQGALGPTAFWNYPLSDSQVMRLYRGLGRPDE